VKESRTECLGLLVYFLDIVDKRKEIPLPAMYPVISKKAGIMTLMVCRADLSYIVRDFELGLPFQPLTLFYFIFILVFRRRPVKDSTLVIAGERPGRSISMWRHRTHSATIAGDIRTANTGKTPSDEG